jgi:hypothetical protein
LIDKNGIIEFDEFKKFLRKIFVETIVETQQEN